jgi:pilus assembly protein CpaC
MTMKSLLKTGIATAILISVATGSAVNAAPAKRAAKVTATPAVRSANAGFLEMTRGASQQVSLPSAITDIVISDPSIADIDVKSPRQIWVFAKSIGETVITATDANGRVVYTSKIRVTPRMNSLDEMFALAMPDAKVVVTTLPAGVLLTGSVVNPSDVAEAEDLARSFLDPGTKVISRIKTATPYQVNLQVRVAEVSRSLAKEMASNFTTRDNNGGSFLFGIGRGRQASIVDGPNGAGLPLVNACANFALPTDCGLVLPFNPQTRDFVTGVTTNVTQTNTGNNLLNLAGRLFGLDVAAAFDVAERAGLATTLAQPNLTTMSGETAEFLAGGSFPIPVSDSFGSVSVTQQSYGINLTYTPTVLSDGRIRLQVSPEVSDITSNGAVRIGGTEIPALLTRRASTTVELGSGQSFMIAGLLSNSANSSVDKYPGLGDVPVLGSLFKSNGWRKNQTELVIVVTPYLVKPVSEEEIKLPTDGFNAPSDLERILLNKQSTSSGMTDRPRPTIAPEAPKGPDMGSISQAAPPIQKKSKETKAAANAPGFSFD